ncbi:MAG: VOC family protein, partial [Clostridiales bacterium]|nr:VOC family protein [Clostridiales bacterium]
MQIQWITIRVADLEKSKRFYADFLGMRLEQEFSPSPAMTIVFFAAENGAKIELISGPPARTAPAVPAVSIGIGSSDYAALLQSARE